jgi:hypothetical protein
MAWQALAFKQHHILVLQRETQPTPLGVLKTFISFLGRWVFGKKGNIVNIMCFKILPCVCQLIVKELERHIMRTQNQQTLEAKKLVHLSTRLPQSCTCGRGLIKGILKS